jgi:hypothetical protein
MVGAQQGQRQLGPGWLLAAAAIALVIWLLARGGHSPAALGGRGCTRRRVYHTLIRMTFEITAASPDHPGLLLELPWRIPLEKWPDEHLVALPQGISP